MAKRSLFVIAALATPAAAMPPPVEVSPVVWSSAEDAGLRADVVRLIERLGNDGHFKLAGVTTYEAELDPCWRQQNPDGKCLDRAAPKKVELEPALSVVIDDPQWRQASIRVRCVGPDVQRARSIELYVSDALGDRPNALEQKSKLAGCMIGALYGAPSKDGLGER